MFSFGQFISSLILLIASFRVVRFPMILGISVSVYVGFSSFVFSVIFIASYGATLVILELLCEPIDSDYSTSYYESAM
jgi:hypothetical protein